MGETSGKATTSSSSWRKSVGISPETMRQNRQSESAKMILA